MIVCMISNIIIHKGDVPFVTLKYKLFTQHQHCCILVHSSGKFIHHSFKLRNSKNKISIKSFTFHFSNIYNHVCIGCKNVPPVLFKVHALSLEFTALYPNLKEIIKNNIFINQHSFVLLYLLLYLPLIRIVWMYIIRE